MSSMPECKTCGNYIHHGFVICQDCLDKHDENIRQDELKKVYKKLKQLPYLIWQSPQSYGQRKVVDWSDIELLYKEGGVK